VLAGVRSRFNILNRKLVRALTIISKVTVTVRRYKKSLNNIKCFFYNAVLSWPKELRIHYVFAGVRSRFNIINRKLLRALTIIISKVTVSVSKYKPLNNIKYLYDNCFFYNPVVCSSNS